MHSKTEYPFDYFFEKTTAEEVSEESDSGDDEQAARDTLKDDTTH